MQFSSFIRKNKNVINENFNRIQVIIKALKGRDSQVMGAH
jgi:hypothetical protein